SRGRPGRSRKSVRYRGNFLRREKTIFAFAASWPGSFQKSWHGTSMVFRMLEGNLRLFRFRAIRDRFRDSACIVADLLAMYVPMNPMHQHMSKILKFTQFSFRDLVVAAAPTILAIVGICLIAYFLVDPAPPRTVRLGTGQENSAYAELGKKYAAALAKHG